MRHNRDRAFDDALREPHDPTLRWSDLCADPNEPRALVLRSRALSVAWQPDVDDRVAFIQNRCRGKSVLDVGCVAHDVARLESDEWLHGRIASVAGWCVGVDVDSVGVKAMVDRGYRALRHDLTDGIGPVGELGPFDVLVAGEVIEHLADLGMLFRTARDVLAAEGELIITTPNPFDPDRVWAGQRGIVWENADHVMYAFPAGIAELASRHGLVLSELMCTSRPRPSWMEKPLRSLKRAIRGTGWRVAGFETRNEVRPTVIRPMQWLTDSIPRPRRFRGPTVIYVVRRG